MRYIYVQLIGLFLIIFGIVNFIIWYFTSIEFCLFATISIAPGIYNFYKHKWTKNKSENILVASLLILLSLTTAINRQEKNNDLYLNGVLTRGCIVSKNVEFNNRSTNFYANFNYKIKDGAESFGTSEINSKSYSTLHKGDSIYVMYSDLNSNNIIINEKPINPLKRWTYTDAIWKGKGGLKYWISFGLNASIGILLILVIIFSLLFIMSLIIRLIK